ncbi:hypothetical protein GCM10011611_43310 [Aliidongia dinghuensis]|uniref:DUF3576 domain-containing protein n=1 Tax=Aliidongia dinghuensis TaxID=1867774 RepID=A0A8J3E538_9PROT|nr:DUF3576 domain-containing protein [Aliidongia dinghuensis]GGF32461.1 hypothetical protein GCM10011611_43310 [Aliidongia dinghuensis]
MVNRLRATTLALGLATAAVLAGCSDISPSDTAYRPNDPRYQEETQGDNSLFGSGGLVGLLGGGSKKDAPGAQGIGVNTFLWRASLDTVSFMPLTSADPFGGVIITDWYTPPETPNERFKLNVYILDRQLRADGIKATVFRQSHTPDGRWVDATVDPKTAADLENAILTRARQLRVNTAQQSS